MFRYFKSALSPLGNAISAFSFSCNRSIYLLRAKIHDRKNKREEKGEKNENTWPAVLAYQ